MRNRAIRTSFRRETGDVTILHAPWKDAGVTEKVAGGLIPAMLVGQRHSHHVTQSDRLFQMCGERQLVATHSGTVNKKTWIGHPLSATTPQD